MNSAMCLLLSFSLMVSRSMGCSVSMYSTKFHYASVIISLTIFFAFFASLRLNIFPILKKFGSFVKKLKRKNIITDAEALRKDYPQISPMTEIKSLKIKL